MFELNLKNKYYLPITIVLLINGCGGSESNTPNIVQGEISSFSSLTSQEQENLSFLSTNQQELLDAINKERSQSRTCGDRGTFPAVHALTWNPELYASALEHVTDLAYSNTFSHDGSGTEYDITGNGTPSKFYERIIANGYSNYFSVGENIAAGQRSVEEVMKAWMASPGHCENIMKSTYTEVGVAIIIKTDSDYQIYWGQNFGSKKQ
ncbi:MAG: hypothetical protein DSZ07_02535 [Sulfurovum sp.]|nr:MAG: hypothetical protein DSZ07_02535 [Sulfurovum sp.]